MCFSVYYYYFIEQGKETKKQRNIEIFQILTIAGKINVHGAIYFVLC
jgi:hypothetical protein